MTRDSIASEEKSSRSYWGFVLWPVAVIVLYVLSAGPVWLAINKGILPWNTHTIYTPIWEGLGGTWLTKPFGMYIHLWAPAVYDRHGNALMHIVPD